MNILVCVKQVPDTDNIKIDPVTNTLIRSGVSSIVNPFDSYALETAVRMKEEYGGFVTVITMGPEQAVNALRSCLSTGADRAFLISDKAFGGSDTLATSYVLSTAIRYIEGEVKDKFDIILCGKQAIDGDTGQVGAELAEYLDYPQVTNAKALYMQDECLMADRENNDCTEIHQITTPAVITMGRTAYEPRLAGIKGKLAARKAEIPVLTLEELQPDRERIGLKGSPTRVNRSFVPNMIKEGIHMDGKNTMEAAEVLAEFLLNKGLL